MQIVNYSITLQSLTLRDDLNINYNHDILQ